VVVADLWAQVPDPGLARRPTLLHAQIGDGVVHVDGTAEPVCVGEDVGGVTQQQMFPQTRRDLIAIDRDMAGGQIDHRLQADAAVVPEQHVQPTQ